MAGQTGDPLAANRPPWTCPRRLAPVGGHGQPATTLGHGPTGAPLTICRNDFPALSCMPQGSRLPLSATCGTAAHDRSRRVDTSGVKKPLAPSMPRCSPRAARAAAKHKQRPGVSVAFGNVTSSPCLPHGSQTTVLQAHGEVGHPLPQHFFPSTHCQGRIQITGRSLQGTTRHPSNLSRDDLCL